MFILKPIELVYQIRTEFIKLITKSENDLNSTKLQKYSNDYNQLEAKDSLHSLQNVLKHEKSLRKTKLITFFALFGAVTSISLTLAGTGKINFFNIATINTPNLTYILIILFLQSMLFFLTGKESVIKKKYYNHYAIFKLAQFTIVTSSIYYNFKFFLMYFENMNIIEKIITGFICIGLDTLTLKLISLRYDMKNNIESYQHDSKIKKYFGSLQKNKSNQDSLQSNQSKLIETDTLQSTLQNTLQCNESSNVCNESKKNTVQSKNTLTENIEQKIDQYILEKYNLNDLVNVKEIKEKFNIKKQREWAKIIPKLKTAEIVKGRLRRIKLLSLAK